MASEQRVVIQTGISHGNLVLGMTNMSSVIIGLAFRDDQYGVCEKTEFISCLKSYYVDINRLKWNDVDIQDMKFTVAELAFATNEVCLCVVRCHLHGRLWSPVVIHKLSSVILRRASYSNRIFDVSSCPQR